MGIESTNRCNAKCIMCNRMFTRKDEGDFTGLLEWKTLEKCSSFFPYCEQVSLGGFGEPFLHPEYIEMADYIKKFGPYVYCFTNGSLLNENRLSQLVNIGYDEICVSLGGATPETHNHIRGVANFDQIIHNLMMLNEMKKLNNRQKPYISFNIVAMNSLLEEMDEIVDLAIKLDVHCVAMPNLIAHGKEMIKESAWEQTGKWNEVWARSKSVLSRHNIRFDHPDLTEKKGACGALFSDMYITWDGNVLSCALERFILGSLQTSCIEDIWNNEKYVSLRRRYFDEGLAAICPNCYRWDNRKEVFLSPCDNSRRSAEECEPGQFVAP